MSVDAEGTPKPQPMMPLFSPGVRAGDVLYVSGQLGVSPATGRLVEGGIEGQTRQTIENIQRVLADNGYSLRQVVKTTCYLRTLADYAAFNRVYGEYFSQPFPARATVGGVDLVVGGLVEIECVASK